MSDEPRVEEFSDATQVAAGEFPVLFRVLQSFLETLFLFSARDMEKELADGDAAVGKELFKGVYVIVSFPP